ncbi:MAG: hypothetical protein ABJA64_02265 [Candidatus Saccharibacteria bacterium]
MRRFNHPIVQKIAALKVPKPEEIVLNHGGALVVRGLREEHSDGDIDMSASWENIEYLRLVLGWISVDLVVGETREGLPRTINATRDRLENHRFDVHRWDYSPQRFKETGKGRMYLDEQIVMSEQDEETGLWVAKPELVLMTKQGSPRQKDKDDIALITIHLDQLT